MSVDVGESRRDVDSCRTGALQNRKRQRVLRKLLDRGRRCQQLCLGNPWRDHHLDHVGLPQGQGAGLVKNNDRQLGRVFQRCGVLEQDAIHGAEAGTDHDRHRRRQPKRIGAGDHEHRNREGQREQQ